MIASSKQLNVCSTFDIAVHNSNFAALGTNSTTSQPCLADEGVLAESIDLDLT